MTQTSPLVTVPCPVCGSTRSRFCFSVRDYSRRITDSHFGVRRCRRCGCGYLSPRPAPEGIHLYYDRNFYWSHEGAPAPLCWEDIIRIRRDQLDAKAACLAGMPPGRLLDIGAQKGDFLWFMRRKGWEVEGVEIESDIPNPADMPIHYGDFLKMPLPEAGYDCVTMWAVLEHVYQPRLFMEKAARLLRPGGRFIALVTNFDSLQARLYRADDYPRHLTFFTRSSIRHLTRSVGLDLTRTWTSQDIFGGKLEGGLVLYLKHALGYTLDEALLEWRQTEDPLLFNARWRGRSSRMIRLAHRADWLVSIIPERLLDKISCGFIMTFIATRPGEAKL